jgi:hypothetical protein
MGVFGGMERTFKYIRGMEHRTSTDKCKEHTTALQSSKESEPMRYHKEQDNQ